SAIPPLSLHDALAIFPPNKPPYEPHRYREYLRSALLLRELKAAGVPGVVDAHCFGVGGCRLFNAVSIQQRYAGHARGLQLAEQRSEEHTSELQSRRDL